MAMAPLPQLGYIYMVSHDVAQRYQVHSHHTRNSCRTDEICFSLVVLACTPCCFSRGDFEQRGEWGEGNRTKFNKKYSLGQVE